MIKWDCSTFTDMNVRVCQYYLYRPLLLLVRGVHDFSYFVLFIYLGFYASFNTVWVISRWVVGRAEETSTYSWSRFCTVNCRPVASNYQLEDVPGTEPRPQRWFSYFAVNTLNNFTNHTHYHERSSMLVICII